MSVPADDALIVTVLNDGETYTSIQQTGIAAVPGGVDDPERALDLEGQDHPDAAETIVTFHSAISDGNGGWIIKYRAHAPVVFEHTKLVPNPWDSDPA